MKVGVLVSKFGLTTGEMPHLRWPPKNGLPGQNLYYLYSACTNLGYDTMVVDANWSSDPIGRLLEHAPDVVLISTATPSFAGTLDAIASLRARDYAGPIYVGGPHVSLNWGRRNLLLPDFSNVHYIPVIGSSSTFDWVPKVFSGRSMFEVLGRSEGEARRYISERLAAEEVSSLSGAPLDKYLFSFFEPSIEWMADTYHGDHIRPEMREVEIRYSMITSIGCSNGCSFCGNPYIYQPSFMAASTLRRLVHMYKRHDIHRVSLADMNFAMSRIHANMVMRTMREEEMKFSMQTCLEHLDDALLAELRESGLQKLLVGIENPVSRAVDKVVKFDRLYWLLDAAERNGLEGVKLSYLVGLPGVSLDQDLALLDHVIKEVVSCGHPLCDLQVNLCTPYRPEANCEYVSYDPRLPPREHPQRIFLLDALSFRYWGSFPVAIADARALRDQMTLCDIIYDRVYTEFSDRYLEKRAEYCEDLRRHYPDLAAAIPTFDESRRHYRQASRGPEALRLAGGKDGNRSRQVSRPAETSRLRRV
jgi:radical SAM superfamily enzyme YgiQ (UPF0313 family)